MTKEGEKENLWRRSRSEDGWTSTIFKDLVTTAH